MNTYNTLIFDLDDTLINDSKSIEFAFYEVYKYLGFVPNLKAFEDWLTHDRSYWYKWDTNQYILPPKIKEKEEISLYRRSLRFLLFFKDLHLEYSEAVKLNKIYIEHLGDKIEPIFYAKEILEYLSIKYSIVIGTNGPKTQAYEKIEKAGLKQYITKVICSDDIGYAKPKKEFFDYLFSNIHSSKTETLLIGDSLTTDIKGGMNYNIDTCWFHSPDQILPEIYKPTYTITKLEELKRILK